MQGRRQLRASYVLVLSVAWSTVGMQIHVCSGPLAPESCIQAFCRLFLCETDAGDAPVFPPGNVPDSSAPANDEEDGAETPFSALKTVCLSPVDRNHRRSRRTDSAALAVASRLRRLSAPGGPHVSFTDTPPPPADTAFRVCQLLF